VEKVLVVEDSETLLAFEVEMIQERLRLEVLTATTYAEAQKVIASNKDDIFVALVDLVLPDAQYGEVIDLVLENLIPTIVFTGEYNNDLREFILQKRVVDYILKNNLNNFQYALRLIKRIYENRNMKAIIVDDSDFMRLKSRYSLSRLEIESLEAKNGYEALDLLDKHNDIRLILVDFNMKEMDGIELTDEIRKKYGNDELCIIGYSANRDPQVCIEFLKKGANDFLPQSFSEEEFTLRVVNNLEMLDLLKSARENAIRDFLSKLYNRRYFYDVGYKLFDNAKRGNITLYSAMIDIDHFKKINDTYGHHIGDKAIIHISNLLGSSFRDGDIIARVGGEEFAILVVNCNRDFVVSMFEKLREKIELSHLYVMHKDKHIHIPITVSIGVNLALAENFDDFIALTDEKLYESKTNGRNRVSVFY